jgi:hypothetical protein
MKILSTFIIAVLFVHFSHAQEQNLMPLIGKVPPIPHTVCQDTKDQKIAFKKQVSDVNSLVKMESKRISDFNKVSAEQYQEQAMKKMAGNYGLNEEDIKRLNQGEASEQLKKQMADKALQSMANMSMDEVKKLQSMSDEGKKAWAEGYGYEKMAEASIDSTRLKNERNKNMNQFELMQLQLQLNDTINKMDMYIAQKYSDLMSDPVAMEKLQNIYQIKNQLANTTPLDDQYDILKSQLEQNQKEYCDTFTNRYLSILETHFNQFMLSIPLYNNVEDISNQLTEFQTGTTMNMAIGSMALSHLDSYLNHLKEAYQYHLIFE